MSDANKIQFKNNELEKFVAISFLRNANHHQDNNILVEYRNNYANKFDHYPKSLEDVMDGLRQVPPKNPRSKNSNNNDKNSNEKDKVQNLRPSTLK